MNTMKQKITKIRNKILDLNWPPFIKKALKHWLSLSFLKYLATGFSAFFLQILNLNLLTELFHIEKIPANYIATFISQVYIFLLSTKWTFKGGSDKNRNKLIKYTLLCIFNYCFDTVVAFPILVHWGVNQNIAKVLITAIVTVWNFFLYKLVVFK